MAEALFYNPNSDGTYEGLLVLYGNEFQGSEKEKVKKQHKIKSIDERLG